MRRPGGSPVDVGGVVPTRRPGTPADAVGGVVPAEVVAPGSVEEVRDVLRTATRHRATVVPVGAGTKTVWAAPPTSCDIRLDLHRLDRVLEHTAGDLVVVAEAGVTLDALQARVAGSGQLLGLDPPEPGATLGGVVSANASGPRRLRYGTVRDLLIGVTVVLADGTLASAGGKVVKNVAGYDLGKLYTGAHGTLGVVVSTTWRLHPRPAARSVVTVDVPGLVEASRLARLLARSTLTPAAVELLGGPGADVAGADAATLVVLFESIQESVDAQAQATVGLLGGSRTDTLPPAFGPRPGGDGDLVLRLAYAPAALPTVLAALPPAAGYTASACSGVAYVALPAAEGVAALGELRGALASYDGSAVVIAAPPQLRGGLDHWGPVGDALGLMRRVKERFDPQRLLSPGRFVGGL